MAFCTNYRKWLIRGAGTWFLLEERNKLSIVQIHTSINSVDIITYKEFNLKEEWSPKSKRRFVFPVL